MYNITNDNFLDFKLFISTITKTKIENDLNL